MKNPFDDKTWFLIIFNFLHIYTYTYPAEVFFLFINTNYFVQKEKKSNFCE